jgi:hypothetical protein
MALPLFDALVPQYERSVVAAPSSTLMDVARRLAEYRLARPALDVSDTPHAWPANTWWRDEGVFDSGDQWKLWIVCEL